MSADLADNRGSGAQQRLTATSEPVPEGGAMAVGVEESAAWARTNLHEILTGRMWHPLKKTLPEPALHREAIRPETPIT
ncbi:hypothetical protein GCM10010399_50050 [Dactylosporangium fulvum]|uniref:Transposase n=1 Tax=Dactylosporangium fulvum TaxID=53359 RepID=A0ABY5VVM1_9ACTN|nr:hypothetical protein [Dactylosporangium fulvum]UWP81109.1 hypothetical protein Dfulv_39255 [Dactylosporangium fulvum]